MRTSSRSLVAWSIATLLAVVGGFAIAAPARAQDTARWLARINDTYTITEYDLAQRVRLLMVTTRVQDTPDNRQRIARLMLRQMIDERLQLNEAERNQVKVNRSEIEERIGQLEQANRLPPGGLRQALESAGLKYAVFEAQIEANIAWGKFVRRRMRSQVEVSEGEVDDVLARLKADLGKPEYRVSEIFLPVDRPEMADEVFRNAQRLLDQLRATAPFAALAQQFSQGPTAAQGGDLGWVLPGSLDPALEAALRNLQPGRITDQPVRSGAGWHIMALVDRRAFGQGGAPQEIRLHLVQLLLALPTNASATEVELQTSNARQIISKVTKCADLRTLGQRTKGASANDLERVRAGDLGPMGQQLSQAPVGTAVGPLRLADSLQIVAACSRDGEGGLPSRDSIQQTLLATKLEAAARRAMRDLRRTAIVDIRG